MVLFSVSNGYLASICMMSAPKICHPDDQQIAANLMVALLGLGLGTGAGLSNAAVLLLWSLELKKIQMILVQPFDLKGSASYTLCSKHIYSDNKNMTGGIWYATVFL